MQYIPAFWLISEPDCDNHYQLIHRWCFPNLKVSEMILEMFCLPGYCVICSKIPEFPWMLFAIFVHLGYKVFGGKTWTQIIVCSTTHLYRIYEVCEIWLSWQMERSKKNKKVFRLSSWLRWNAGNKRYHRKAGGFFWLFFILSFIIEMFTDLPILERHLSTCDSTLKKINKKYTNITNVIIFHHLHCC